MLSPAWDVVPFLPLALMQLSLFYSAKVNVIELPPFQPNEYLFQTHANKGKDKWEIFAWAVRECMADAGNLIKNSQPYREKLHYEAIMGQRSMPKIGPSETEPLLNKNHNELAGHH